jgi:integrase
MGKAGLPPLDEKGRKRKPLHSLRATFTRRMLEQGKHPQWVQAQLGHSSAELTQNVYGSWSDEALRAEALRKPSTPLQSASAGTP